MTPNHHAEWVRRYTSQASPAVCIQVPVSETSCPLKKSWKLRWRRARKVTGSRLELASDIGLYIDVNSWLSDSWLETAPNPLQSPTCNFPQASNWATLGE